METVASKIFNRFSLSYSGFSFFNLWSSIFFRFAQLHLSLVTNNTCHLSPTIIARPTNSVCDPSSFKSFSLFPFFLLLFYLDLLLSFILLPLPFSSPLMQSYPETVFFSLLFFTFSKTLRSMTFLCQKLSPILPTKSVFHVSYSKCEV